MKLCLITKEIQHKMHVTYVEADQEPLLKKKKKKKLQVEHQRLFLTGSFQFDEIIMII